MAAVEEAEDLARTRKQIKSITGVKRNPENYHPENHRKRPVTYYPCIVTNPEKFGKIFKKGDRVFEIGIKKRSPRKIVQELKQMEKDIGFYRTFGYKGMFGVTGNKALLRIVKKIAERNGLKFAEIDLDKVQKINYFAKSIMHFIKPLAGAKLFAVRF